jgi:hypothetical protein
MSSVSGALASVMTGVLDWVYANSPCVVIPIFVVGAVGVSSLCLWLRYWRTDFERGTRYGRLAEFIVTNIAVIYAVLLAFIAVATWESYGKASDLTLDEASLAANLYRDAGSAPEPTRTTARSGIARYLSFVAGDPAHGKPGEWRAMRGEVAVEQDNGRCQPQTRPIACGWGILAGIRRAVASMAPNPAKPGQAVLMQQMLRDLDALYIARSSRLDAARGHIPSLVWAVIIILGFATIGYAMFVDAHGLASHMLMLAGLTAAITLVIALIVELDFPFRGVISVDPQAYTRALVDLRAGG